MGDTGQDIVFEVLEHSVERLTILWWMRWYLTSYVTGLHLRSNRQIFNIIKIIVGHPVDKLVRILFKIVFVHTYYPVSVSAYRRSITH